MAEGIIVSQGSVDKTPSAFTRAMRKFITTDFYFIIVMAIVTAAWILESAELGFIGLIAISSVALLFADDIVPFTANIFGAVLMIYDSEVSTFIDMWWVFIPLGIALIVFIARNVRGKKFKLGKMFFPQLAVTVALFVGGLGVVEKEDYMRALPTVIMLGVGVLAIYLLYVNFAKRDEHRDYGLMFAKIMMYIGLAVCVELIVCIARSGLETAEWHRSYWDVGWGNRNNIATYLLFTAPMSLYLATRYKNSGWIYIILGVVQYACLIMTFSRGGILFGAIGGVFALVMLIVKAPSKKRMLITVGAVIVAIGIFGIVFRDKISDMFESLFSRGTGLSGRDRLYDEAWELFLEHPILGVGMGYVGTGPSSLTTMQMYLFHSTFYQVVACMGVVGIVCYLYYYGARFWELFRGIKHKFNLFVLASWIGFEGYSMVDTGTMVPFPNMILVIVTVLILEILPRDDRFEGIPDKYNKTFGSIDYKA